MSSEIDVDKYWSVKAPEDQEALAGAPADLSADIKALKRDLARLHETFAATTAAGGVAGSSRLSPDVREPDLREAADSAYGARAAIASSARRHAVSFADDIKVTVRRNPQGTLLAAIGLGIILGMMFRSR